MHAWRKYKKRKGRRNVVLFPCRTNCFEATDKARSYIFRRFVALLKAQTAIYPLNEERSKS